MSGDRNPWCTRESMWWPDHQSSYLQQQQQQHQDQSGNQHQPPEGVGEHGGGVLHHHGQGQGQPQQQQQQQQTNQSNQQPHQQQDAPSFRSSPLFHGYKIPGPFHPPPQTPSPSYMAHSQPHTQWWYSNPIDSHVSNMQIPATHTPLDCRGNKMSKVKSDAKPRGRMTAYAFFVQICREEHKKKHPNENVVFAEFSKRCAERWKTMSDKEKKRFHDMADKDKKRYETEMKGYTPSENDKKRGKKRKQIKDPNAPKRALSAFFWFCNDERSKVKEAHPEFTVGDIAKELGRRWSEAEASTKSKYEEMADKDKARYDREMTEYKKKGKVTSSSVPETKKAGSEDDEGDEDEDEDDE